MKTQKYRIEIEIDNIKNKILKEEDSMAKVSDEFFRHGGVCCPFCGVPGYSERVWAQERRVKWLAILQAKYVRDKQPKLGQ